MHRLTATPGGWTPDSDGVIFLEQSPAPVVVLTAADTDLHCLAQVMAQSPGDLPSVRGANLLQLQQQLTIDTYADDVLRHARVILLRLLGGRAYWSYGLEVVREVAAETGAALVVVPGDDRPDPDLISLSTVPLAMAHQVWRYLCEGGVENLRHGLMYLCDHSLDTTFSPPPPRPVPRVGVLGPMPDASDTPRVGILFYRAHYLAGNTAPIDALMAALVARHLTPIAVYASSLQDPEVQQELIDLLSNLDIPTPQNSTPPLPGRASAARPYLIQNSKLTPPNTPTNPHPNTPPPHPLTLLLNTTSFSLAKLDEATPRLDLWETLDVSVLQVILSGGTEAAWQQHPMGLMPRDIAMNVALPEVDGRIITRAVSFKTSQQRSAALEMDVVTYEPVDDRIQFVADLAARWVDLRHTPASERRVALILANYPNRDGRLANGVGLDTPQSCVEILQALAQAGYTVGGEGTGERGKGKGERGKGTGEGGEDLGKVGDAPIPREGGIPGDGDALIQRLTAGMTNDPDAYGQRPAHQWLPLGVYQAWYDRLPQSVRGELEARWGTPAAELAQLTTAGWPTQGGTAFPIAGLQLGHIFVGVQPSRGYDRDPSLNYHAPDLEPTHAYLAFYLWLRQSFSAQAIVHVGKHGNLEWLPGKGVGLAATCYPEIALGPMPHFYPFIVNDPGEGAQAKRRAQAVILDHLTPPLTRAELYGPLQALEGLVDEYYEAQSLDPTRLPVIRDRILTLLADTHLAEDLALIPQQGEQPLIPQQGEQPFAPTSEPLSPWERGRGEGSGSRGKELDLQTLLPQLDGYLCDLKEAQIRDGLHIFGQCPTGQQLRDLIIAIARHPSRDRVGLTRAIAQDLELDLDPLTVDLGSPFEPEQREAWPDGLQGCRTAGDVVALLEERAAGIVAELLQAEGEAGMGDATDLVGSAHPTVSPPDQQPTHPVGWVERSGTQQQPPGLGSVDTAPNLLAPHIRRTVETPAIAQELAWIRQILLPALQATPQEIGNLLKGLGGHYVPSGPAGAPTRNRPDVLPTGRNFYSVDIRAIPTESAWDVGRKAAEVVVERYTQEQGEYPTALGLSLWGTATMRTGGDDLAEALALLGVRPVWDGPSRRVVDFEIVPVSLLGRPRVDVTLRISGFFRDAFPNLIDLFNQAVMAVAALEESPEENPLAVRVRQETAQGQAQGLDLATAELRSRYRVFGSKPGAYGAGLQGLIEAQNWQDDRDLARAYINWSSYAYGVQGTSAAAPEAFSARLAQMQVVLHNQDNREHDLLDSDDYYQFQGGLTAAVRTVSGQQPTTYFGDNAVVENPKVRSLTEEITRVYRSRVVNPKWIAGVMRHGYKGAFEMAATVDYLFAYDATAHCVADHMYTGVAEAYLLDPPVQEFVRQANPWALRDMAERLLEAHQRGLWQQVSEDLLDTLRAIAHEAEADLETRQS